MIQLNLVNACRAAQIIPLTFIGQKHQSDLDITGISVSGHVSSILNVLKAIQSNFSNLRSLAPPTGDWTK